MWLLVLNIVVAGLLAVSGAVMWRSSSGILFFIDQLIAAGFFLFAAILLGVGILVVVLSREAARRAMAEGAPAPRLSGNAVVLDVALLTLAVFILAGSAPTLWHLAQR